MEATRTKIGWKSVLLTKRVLGALVVAAIAAAILGAIQVASAGGSIGHLAGSGAPVVANNTSSGAPLLDTFDRATALLQRDAAQPAETPLLDTFDRATSLMQSSATGSAEQLTDLSDRHTPDELNAIMAGKSK